MRHCVMVFRMTHPDLVGSTEAGRILSKSSRSVHRLVDAGELTPVVVAPGGFKGSYLFDRADVEALRDSRAAKAASEQVA